MPTGTIRETFALVANQRLLVDLGVYRRFLGAGRTTIFATAGAINSVRATLNHSTRLIGRTLVPPAGVAGRTVVPDDLLVQGVARPNEEVQVELQEIAGAAATANLVINFEDTGG
jgi:hypothetical protein